MNINRISKKEDINLDDTSVIRLHRSNHTARIRQATIPTRDPLWQSTFEGTLIPHRDVKRLRKQYSFYTVDEIKAHDNRYKKTS